jgi:molybdopterin-guanine dinucleotide biosynthesis protein A
MDNLHPDVVILAGGMSSRFGGDKAAAVWRGRSLADHVLSRLPIARGEVVVVVRAGQDASPWGVVKVVHDDPALPEGPLRGLIAGLRRCPGDWAWVVGCDLPLLSADLLSALRLEIGPDTVAVVPQWRGRWQPLHALVATDAASALERSLVGGCGALVRALETLPATCFNEERCRLFAPDGACFTNVNRREDLAELEERLRAVDPKAGREAT